MRIVFIGVSHWHTGLYLGPARKLPDIQIAGVSDSDPAAARIAAERAGCPAWMDYREMCATTRPDFAFALGRHCEMARIARFLIEERIAFAIEKPCGISTAEVEEIARRAQERGVFASVCLVMRLSPILETLQEIATDERIQYGSFKFVAGPVQRYRDDRVDWMLHRASAGGGCTLNLGVHFLDLYRLLSDGEPEVAGALMSNAAAALDVEDHGVVLLRTQNSAGMVETGYIYPAPGGVFDMHLSIKTENHYFVARDPNTLEIVNQAQHHEIRPMPTTNMGLYPVFVRDVLERVERGRPPIADLADMAATMRLVETAYALSPLPVTDRR